jgi:PAS domain S-box-containing protein
MGTVALDTGALTPDQVNLMLKYLPLDITFVDENDRVAYYSAGLHRIFPRSAGIIGREVKRCHPPTSVHIVENIVNSFKNKEKDKAEFWINSGGKTIHITFYPLFDDDGNYKGTIEITQDVTEIKKLEGEKRLLEWTQ